MQLKTKTQPASVAFFFGIGHGHFAQYLNFQECTPTDGEFDPHFFALYGESSEDFWSKLPLLPQSRRYGRNQMWHLKQGLAAQAKWDALFLATDLIIGMAPIVNQYPCYFYRDFSDSRMRELTPWYDYNFEGNQFLRRFRLRMQRQLYEASRGIFTMSRWAADGIQLDFGLPANKVHVVHPGANLKRWRYVERQGRPADRPVKILMVGSEFRRKGGEMILDWAEQTQARNWKLDIVTWPGDLPDWVLACLGHPTPDEPVSRSLAPRLPNVRVHCGVRANTPEAMQRFAEADLFCLPTLADGSSIASLEAMATGLPVLTGAVGGIPELIADGGTGFLLSPGDAEELDDRLTLLINDAALRRKIGRAARQACEDYYNVERQVAQILTIIGREAEA